MILFLIAQGKGETVKNAYGLFLSGYYGYPLGIYAVGGGGMAAIGNWFEPLAFLVTAHGLYSPDSSYGAAIDFSVRGAILGQRKFRNTNGNFLYLSFGLGVFALPGAFDEGLKFYKVKPDINFGLGFEWAISPEVSLLGQIRYDVLGLRSYKENVAVAHLGFLIYGR